MGIIGVAWLLVFLGSYIIFYLIVPIDLFPGTKDYVLTFFNSLLKVVLSIFLSIIWILIMIKLRDIYIKRKL